MTVRAGILTMIAESNEFFKAAECQSGFGLPGRFVAETLVPLRELNAHMMSERYDI